MSLLQSIRNNLFGGQSVDLVVYVPAETPDGEAIYVSGACSKLGRWNATGLRLKQIDRGVWQRRVTVPADQPLEFKVTRGSWDKVERHADGAETGNHRVEPDQLGEGVVRHTVESWADAG